MFTRCSPIQGGGGSTLSNITTSTTGIASGNRTGTYTCEKDFCFFSYSLVLAYDISGYVQLQKNGEDIIPRSTTKKTYAANNLPLKKGDVISYGIGTSSNNSRYSVVEFDLV